MKYTTTRCRNCGFATRFMEIGVPKFQLGMPLIICPKCQHLILDSIRTEFEFMTEKQRKKLLSHSIALGFYLSCVFFFLFGVISIIAVSISESSSAEIAVFVIVGICLMFFSVYKFVKFFLEIKSGIIEHAIYMSLQRTSNETYVEFLKTCYEKNGIKKIFSAFSGKNDILSNYKTCETTDFYKESKEDFDKLLVFIKDKTAEKDNSSLFSHH